MKIDLTLKDLAMLIVISIEGRIRGFLYAVGFAILGLVLPE